MNFERREEKGGEEKSKMRVKRWTDRTGSEEKGLIFGSARKGG
jgi:hypothetical protein